MRILIASKRAPNTPGRINGGVQTWILTVANELERLGHDVCILDSTSRQPSKAFDIGIFANGKYTSQFFSLCERTLLVSHGVVEDERPIVGASHYAFTSDEVRAHWGGNKRDQVIAQPIDLNEWRPANAGRKALLVRYANRGGLHCAPAVAHAMGLAWRHVRTGAPATVRLALAGACCVLASGRAALEAMACGAPTIICDDRHYQGPLLDIDLARAKRANYSGRGGIVPTELSLKTAVEQAMAKAELWPPREWVVKHHSASAVVQRLLSCFV